uniref:Uncharacterized protein n=1 Tax=Nelumbo nucifera TaxID=4432 RepID=A0A822Z389_NELNU|nr:TPA_asm: hypothetical protein HUJ06_008802 [Nelumbo nucifera]
MGGTKSSERLFSPNDVHEDGIQFQASRSSSNHFGPELEMVPKQIRLTDLKAIDGDVFTGSVFLTSPFRVLSLSLPSSPKRMHL